MMRVAFLGTGLMGAPMVRRLLAAGHAVVAWNRSADKALALQSDGACVARHAEQAVAKADAVITMLADGAAVERVLLSAEVTAALRAGTLVIDMSSIAPAQARQHAALLRAQGLRYLDAPVSGGTLGAEAGTLVIMAGGDVIDVEAARPLLDALGRVTHVGPTGCGQLVKLANQMIVGMTIGAVAEALLLVERAGGDPAKAIAAMRGGFADSRILEVHGTRMAQRDFTRRAAMAVQLKDLDNALATAGALDLPITALLAQLYREAIASGDGDLDHSALWREIDRRNRPGH
jgi:2-hydroxy-3-oxopropionate reductase